MTKGFLRIFAIGVLLLTVVVTKASASTSKNYGYGRKEKLTYRQKLHAEYEKLSQKDHALLNIVTQYKRKQGKACPANIENRCELYTRKIRDAYRIHQEILESKTAIKEELIMSEDDPEAEEESFEEEDIEVAQEDSTPTRPNRGAVHDEFSVY